MKCGNCGNEAAYRVSGRALGFEDRKALAQNWAEQHVRENPELADRVMELADAQLPKVPKVQEQCDACGNLKTVSVPDVYFRKPYFDEHLSHPEHSPKGNFVESRGHKAALMRTLNVREVGDKVHGARDQY